MNAHARKEALSLHNCPVCGLDSGERFQEEKTPFLYYVRCMSCGAVTPGYGTKTGATKAWHSGKVNHP